MTGRASQRRYLLLVLLAGLILCLPVVLHGIPDLSNDGVGHAIWAQNFGRQMWAGDIYPRWFTDVNAGFGSPAFFFYPPFQAFFAALFWPLTHSWDPHGWATAGFSLVIATLLSGLFCFLWIRRLVGDRSATVGALIYMVAPYHLAIDLYNRGAAAEYWIFVWIPLVMIAVERVVANSRYGVVGLTLAYSLCVLSHTTVGACFAAVPVAYAFFFSQKGSRIRPLVLTVIAVFIGIGLSAFFLLPAALDQGKTYVSLYTSDWGDYRNWWLFNIRDKITEAGTQGAQIPWYLSFKMRMLVITLWMVGFCGLTYWFSQRNRQAVFYLFVTLCCFFLMLEQSDLIWRVVPVLRLLQFPLRLSTMIVMSASVLGALAWANLEKANLEKTKLEKTRVRWGVIAIVFSIGGWLAADAVFARQAFSVWRRIPPQRAERAAFIVRSQQEFPSYWPRDARVNDLLEGAAFDRFVAAHPPKTAVFPNGAGSASIVSWHPRLVELAIHAPAGGQMILNHFYYQGWVAEKKTADKKGGGTIPLAASHPDGLMELSVPPGDYTAVVRLPYDRAEQQGFGITLMSLGALAMMAMWRRRAILTPPR